MMEVVLSNGQFGTLTFFLGSIIGCLFCIAMILLDIESILRYRS